jgi:hypothetical protein
MQTQTGSRRRSPLFRLAHTLRFVSATRDTSVQPARTGTGRLGKYDPLDAHFDDHGRPLMSWQRR